MGPKGAKMFLKKAYDACDEFGDAINENYDNLTKDKDVFTYNVSCAE